MIPRLFKIFLSCFLSVVPSIVFHRFPSFSIISHKIQSFFSRFRRLQYLGHCHLLTLPNKYCDGRSFASSSVDNKIHQLAPCQPHGPASPQRNRLRGAVRHAKPVPHHTHQHCYGPVCDRPSASRSVTLAVRAPGGGFDGTERAETRSDGRKQGWNSADGCGEDRVLGLSCRSGGAVPAPGRQSAYVATC